jgi:toxin ParE1/3/4
MHHISIRRAAAHDIDDIAAYIKQDNPVRAHSFTSEISARIAQIAERPLSFPAREDLAPGLRTALIGNYLIIFKVKKTMIDIIRVAHGARDLGNLLA